ncbi:MAG: hypothetical protein HOV81_32905 [Kofleriaceae bacterium]|nr:hypothetical protein [Kofleriaceae bacterium]
MRVLVLVLVLGACGESRAPAPIASAPANVVAASAPADAGGAQGYTGAVTLAALLADLLDQANAGPPTATQLRSRYEGSAKHASTAGPNLDHPSWTTSVNGADDVFLDLGGDVVGMQLHEDSRGWGAYVDLAVARGTLADAETVIGKTRSVPRNPDDFKSGPTVAAYVERGGHTVRVFVELDDARTGVRHVKLHFQR